MPAWTLTVPSPDNPTAIAFVTFRDELPSVTVTIPVSPFALPTAVESAVNVAAGLDVQSPGTTGPYR